LIAMEQTLNLNLWEQIFGLPPKGMIVIIDPQVRQGGGQLRSLPLLVELGLTRFTYTTNWRGLDLVPHEFVLVGADTSPTSLVGLAPMCQIVSQAIEDESPGRAARKLLQAFRVAAGRGPLVYVLDSERFALSDSVVAKSFIEEFEIATCYHYPRIFERYLEHVGETEVRLSADRSMNLLLHRMLRARGGSIQKLRELFELRSLTADSLAWDVIEQCTHLPNVRRDDMVVHRALRPWVETDISRVATTILETLQAFDYDPSRLRAQRDHLRGEQ
jgi:hypothetical protein